jgi:hypothetical protein
MKSLETAFDTLGILEDDYLMIRFLQRAERINKEDPLEFEILDGNNRVVLMLHRKKTTYRKYIVVQNEVTVEGKVERLDWQAS